MKVFHKRTMPIRISEAGLELIRAFEGFAAMPYRCPAGVLTVGYGHAVRASESFPRGVTEDQAATMLRQDVEDAERAVRRLLPVPLRQGQFDALVSFTYNLGAGALQRSALRRKVLRGEHAQAADEFLKWVWAGGRKLPGLIRRRTAERALYRGDSCQDLL